MPKYLLTKLRAMGDTVLLSSAVASLKRAQPGAEIHALVPERWAPLLEEHPGIARLWRWPEDTRGGVGKLRAMAAILPDLRAEHFDFSVNFHASGTSAWLSRLSGARVRANHFHGHAHANRHSTVKIAGKGELKPILERDLDALRALGLPLAHPELTHVAVTDAELAWARDWLAQRGLKAPLLSLGLGASRPTKVWPAERFAALAAGWHRRTGGGVLALATPAERKLAEDFLAKAHAGAPVVTRDPKDPDAWSVAQGREELAPFRAEAGFTLRQLAAILSQTKVFAGNDSGPKHLAVAVGTPTVTVFGPENPFEWHPYDRARHPVHFIENLACRTNASPNGTRWCGIPVCTVERHRCMTDIAPEAVLESCMAALPR